MNRRAWLIIMAVAACRDPRGTAAAPNRMFGLAARQTVAFELYGEAGVTGATGLTGATGVKGEAAPGLQLACGADPLSIDASSGHVDAACLSGVDGRDLLVRGTTVGTVAVTTADDLLPTPTTFVVTSGQATTPALAIENASTTAALRVVGSADFSAATYLRLPLRWEMNSCPSAPCTSLRAVCEPGYRLISGNCWRPANAGNRPTAACPATSAGCDPDGDGFLCESNASVSVAYALCLREQ